MGELKRCKQAITIATARLRHVEKFIAGAVRESITEDLYNINAILNPPPEMETVIESIWRHKVTMEVVDDQPPLADLPNWQEYAGSVKRPKPVKVERSVTGQVVWEAREGYTVPLAAESPLINFRELADKRGTLTFTWQE